MDALEKLFGNGEKMRIIKLFLFNHDKSFDVAEVAERAKISQGIARREISNLDKMGFIRSRSYSKEIKIQKNRKMVSAKKRAYGWALNYKFEYLEPLYKFLSDSNLFKQEDMVKEISKAIKIDLLIISGIFIKQADSRVDLLIVGEKLNQNLLDKTIKDIEAKLGRELNYAVFTTTDFRYRLSVFDRLLRDILDYPHQKLVNKLLI